MSSNLLNEIRERSRKRKELLKHSLGRKSITKKCSIVKRCITSYPPSPPPRAPALYFAINFLKNPISREKRLKKKYQSVHFRIKIDSF